MKRFWGFKDDITQPGDGVLEVRGVLTTDGWWDDDEDDMTNAKSFKHALAKYRNVRVVINSPGGDVMAGAEMYSALREHSASGKGTVTVEITALAASAASVVAMAGDEILMSPVAYMMIHNPWTFMIGDAGDMRREADALDEIAEGIITAYQLRTGKSRAKLKEMMEAETYMDARRCVREGFADGYLYAAAGPDDDTDDDDEPDDDDDGVMMRAAEYGAGRAVDLRAAIGGRAVAAVHLRSRLAAGSASDAAAVAAVHLRSRLAAIDVGRAAADCRAVIIAAGRRHLRTRPAVPRGGAVFRPWRVGRSTALTTILALCLKGGSTHHCDAKHQYHFCKSSHDIRVFRLRFET